MSYAYPDGTPALRDVDLELRPGERAALLGPNGAGKTTLVLHLNGILRPDRGVVEVGGVRVERDTLRTVRQRVGLVFQDPDDQLFMPSVREDVAFGPANLGARGPELTLRVDAALDAVGMTDRADRPPHHLSLGERRRVAIATVLAMDPQLLALDEPTSNLDPAGRRELTDLLRALDVTQLVVTHDLPFALELCPRSIVMVDGRMIADGPTLDVLADASILEAGRLELPFGYDLAPLRAAAGDSPGGPSRPARGGTR